MRRIFTLIVLIALPHFVSAQFAYFNSEQFWNKMELHAMDEKVKIHAGDTVIIMASNRVLDHSTFRYLLEKRDGSHIQYFVVHSGNGKWNVQPVHSLKEAVALIPDKNKDWVVYTEGMGKFFTSDADRGMNMAAQYNVNVILLDYPSIISTKKRLGNYFFAMKNAKIAYVDFVPVLDTIKMMQKARQLGTSGVNLFFHSMGNTVMRRLIMNGRLDELNDTRWVNNVILNAPCVPQHGHKKWIDKINFAKHIYIHYNPGDYTLGGAYLLSKRYQLGKQVRRPISEKATYINFNTLAGEGHSNFLSLYGRTEIPQAASRHYNVLFHGDTVSVHNSNLYRPSEHRNIGYDILP